MEHSVGWPVDARTKTAIDAVREQDWTPGLTDDANPDEQTQVAELTGLLRHSVGPDTTVTNQLAAWPEDMRVFARRTPAPLASRPNSAKTRTGGTPRSRPAPRLTRTPPPRRPRTPGRTVEPEVSRQMPGRAGTPA